MNKRARFYEPGKNTIELKMDPAAKYTVLCDGRYFKKGDVVELADDDYSDEPTFRKIGTNEFACVKLADLIPTSQLHIYAPNSKPLDAFTWAQIASIVLLFCVSWVLIAYCFHRLLT